MLELYVSTTSFLLLLWLPESILWKVWRASRVSRPLCWLFRKVIVLRMSTTNLEIDISEGRDIFSVTFGQTPCLSIEFTSNQGVLFHLRHSHIRTACARQPHSNSPGHFASSKTTNAKSAVGLPSRLRSGDLLDSKLSCECYQAASGLRYACDFRVAK